MTEKMTQKEQEKLERNYLKFVDGVEKLSKKYGIAISVVGGIRWDVDGFQDVEYSRDFSSGDLIPRRLVYSDGEEL